MYELHICLGFCFFSGAAFCSKVGITYGDTLLPSKRAYLARNPERTTPAYLKNEWQISTSGIIALSLLYMHTKKGAGQTRARDLLRSLLAALRIDNPVAECGFAHPYSDSAHAFTNCEHVLPSGLCCRHVEQCLAEGLIEEDSHAACIKVLQTFYLRGDLDCTIYWFRVMVSRLSQKIDESVLNVAATNPLEVSSALLDYKQKKRRLDEDYVPAMLESKRSKTVGDLATAMGDLAASSAKSYIGKYCAQYRSAMHMSFMNCQHIGVAYDGGRFGQPKEETIVMCAVDSLRGVAGWCCPQELLE